MKTSSPSLLSHLKSSPAADPQPRTHPMPENKQTNKPSGGAGCPTEFTSTSRLSERLGSSPLTRTQTRTQSLPRTGCWNKAPTVWVRPGEPAWDNVRLPSARVLFRAFGPPERERGEGGLGVDGGRTDGWVVCGNRAPTRLSTRERGPAIRQFAMQICPLRA